MAEQEQGAELPKLTRLDAASILMMSLGEADAAQILKHMGPKEVHRIGTSMANLHNITQDQVEAVMIDFLEEVGRQTGMGVGSDDYIKNMLNEALGEDKASSLIDRILVGGNTTGLDTLKWMDGRAVAELIRYEHPQIQAIVVSYLEPDQSAEVLAILDDKVRLDVMMLSLIHI